MFLIPNPKWKNRTELNKPFKKYLKLMIIGRHFPADVRNHTQRNRILCFVLLCFCPQIFM